MKERPIIMQGCSVNAVLDGRKTQTRRVIVMNGDFVLLDYGKGWWPYKSDDGESEMVQVRRHGKTYLDEVPLNCPYGVPGDRLWVKETWCPLKDPFHFQNPALSRGYLLDMGGRPQRNGSAYRADCDERDGESERCRTELGYKWHSPLFMPRWASRLTLEVTDVRVQRVQEISTQDAIAEGIRFDDVSGYWLGGIHNVKGTPTVHPTARLAFKSLWNSINAKRGYSWEVNPWVWALTFKKIDAER